VPPAAGEKLSASIGARGARRGVSREVHHPLFARLFDRMAAKAEDKGAGEHRDRMLRGLAGRVIEVGAGNGLNFSHYPATVSDVLAVEPEDYLRAKAERVAAETPVSIRVVDGIADRLPAEDGSQDAVVVSLVLCSVPDQGRALAEARRVLRPGGELRFYEHVVSDQPRKARMQHAAAWLWPWVGGGCHPNRDTVGAIERAGFEIGDCERFEFRPSVVMTAVAPHVIGTATTP
jgi:ubiquinone/menaquinone biosynthesis C-methylase UbiE